MKYLLLIALCVGISVADENKSQNISDPCDKAIEKATKVHWDYVNGKTTITHSYNERIKAEKICGFKL